jgi:hypothetical protein
MTDYPELYRRLAKEIIKHEGKIEGEAADFVGQLVKTLQAEGREITPAVQDKLTEYLTAMQAAIKVGITDAVSLATTNLPTIPQNATVSKLAEKAFNQQWPDGLKLSDRLWNWDESARKGLTKVMQDSVKHGNSVNKTVYAMQRSIERANGGQRFKIVETYADDWVKELHESAVAMIHDPSARESWQATVSEIEDRILSLKSTGTRAAAERVFSQIKLAVEKGREELADKAVKWWLYDKQLYSLKRIARTEMATAMHRSVIASTENDESIVGYQWRLSASHPVTDICDYYASVEMGLGKGVFTKDAVPKHKAHPHCMCLLIPRVTPIKQKGQQNYAEWLRNLSKEKQRELLPEWAKTAIDKGTPIEKLVRPDGLGLITLEQYKSTIDPFFEMVKDLKQQVKAAKTAEYWKPDTEQAPWHDASFKGSPVWIKAAIQQHDGDFSGLATKEGGGAWYRRASRQIHMGNYDLGDYQAQGVWRHEYGHYLDHANGRSYTYRSSFEDFTDTIRKETDAIVQASGFGRSSKSKDAFLIQRAESYKNLTETIIALDKPARKAYLNDQAKKLGLSLKEIEGFFAKETAHVDDILARDVRMSLALEAIGRQDAVSFVEAINGNVDTKQRSQNYKKGLVGNFSDLVGSAAKNKILGHGPHGIGGHSNSYLKNPGSSQTEVFANLAALLGSDSDFWHKTTNHFYPALSKLFKEILSNAN